MSKVQLLILSSFASGFGFFSIILAMFAMISRLSFTSFFTLVLTLIFFGFNLIFALHYYTSIAKQLNVKSKRKVRI